jgi:hypothetical protein
MSKTLLIFALLASVLPLEATAREILNATVLRTVMGGKTVHTSGKP